MAYGDPQLLHLDSMLTQMSMGFQNDDYVVDMFYPSISVNKQSNKYYVYNHDLWGRVTDDIRQPGARANELPPMTLSRNSYFVQEHALKDKVPVEEQENADDPLTPLADANERLINTLLLNKEAARVAIVTNSALYNASNVNTLAGTTQWSDYTNSTPITDLKAAKKRVHDILFRDPTVMAMQYEVAVKLEDHPDFIERIKYSQRGVTTDEIISAVAGVPNYKRAGAGQVTSVYGQAEAVGYMWGKHAVLAYVPASPGRKVPAYAYEFAWNYSTGGSRVTERWFDTDHNSDILRARTRYTQQFICVDGSGLSTAGFLLKNAIA